MGKQKAVVAPSPFTMDPMNNQVIVSTDGSALANPNGAMGWGWAEHVPAGRKPIASTGQDCDCGGASNGTNQIGELSAVLQALRTHRGSYPLLIETDSQYAINCSTKWIHGWKKNGWKNSKKEPVKNSDLIKAIDGEIRSRAGKVSFTWVKGHAGDFYNEKVDDLARGFAEKCRAGEISGYMPYEGWLSLINSDYGREMTMPSDPTQAPRKDDPIFDARQTGFLAADPIAASPVTPDLAPAAPQDAARASEQPVGRQQAAIPQAAPPVGRPKSFGFQDQPLYPDSPQTVTTELVAKLNEATAQFNLAAQRLEAASQHMDQAVAKLDEAIRRFDDSSWDNNHQETLF
ncbi:ribonuclease HI [Parascardovia denticolens DSM 10105 = JCM 12538]|uniref:ribonuclease H n=2 Tax=Parascardovia denticolens TaxID=78258 RepID=E6K0U1_PARDN|nr:hypothetical protein HMPREF9017_00451 [Parascardovia denticolens F0305]EFT83422.1 ribonuclease HI [Parascardovia denticolens DSM 10105 = JCM 12538]